MRFISVIVSAVVLTTVAYLCVLSGQLVIGTPELSLSWYGWSLLTVFVIGSVRGWILKPWVDRY